MRREAPLSTITRRKIKSYKSKSDKYGRDILMEVVRGNTSSITTSRRNEIHMKASKDAKSMKNKATKANLKAVKSNLKAAKGGIQGGAGGDIRGIFEIAVSPL